MGTRCMTIVKDRNDKDLVVLYRQFDGYLDGHGSDLKEHFQGFTIGNGLPAGDCSHFANGMNCLAAQVVAAFKADAGGFYLYPADTRGCGEEYVYEISDGGGKIALKIYDEPMTFFGSGGEDCTNLIYDGLLDDFDPGMEIAA